jgi:hypothetical protein
MKRRTDTTPETLKAPVSAQEPDVRMIAFYLPQFHPIPENDSWWEKGFTEWSNVARGHPLFRGHHQPHVPADLGFYDLRLPETRAAQAAEARAHGVYGFCYYHYWFHGQRLLELPFENVLETREPDFPFCVCWANESWSRRWMGEDRAILIRQEYSVEDDHRHAQWLARAAADPRYILVHGRPLFLIYRPGDLPEPHRTTDIFRSTLVRAGLADPWLVGCDAHLPDVDFRTLGFDATMHFEPQLGCCPDILDEHRTWAKLKRNLSLGVLSAKLRLYDDATTRRAMAGRWDNGGAPGYPCRYVSWDNTPRRGRDGIIMVNGSPQNFEEALRDAVRRVRTREPGDRLVFIDAWNEWAEGNHLEPDEKHGRAYLEAVARVAKDAGRKAG